MIRHLSELLIGAIIILALFAALSGVKAECGRASWYGSESGSRTANGEHFDGSSLTAAHRTLPFGTKLRISYNGKSVVVRVNDRGPYAKGRGLDLSKAAFAKLAPTSRGVIRVCVARLR